MRFLPEPVQILSQEWDIMIAAASRVRPALIVLDTQARMTVGAEENSAKEMGLVVDRAEALRRATGACVLLVHHLSKAGGGQRGSGATYGAAQTELTVSREEGKGRRGDGVPPIIWLSQTKQKDSDELPPLRLTTVGVPGVSEPDEFGIHVPVPGSVVLVEAAAVETPESTARAVEVELRGGVQALAEIMRATFSEGVGGTKAEAKGLWVKSGRVAGTSFYRAWNQLIDMGMIGKVGGTFGSYRWIPIEERQEQNGQNGNEP